LFCHAVFTSFVTTNVHTFIIIFHIRKADRLVSRPSCLADRTFFHWKEAKIFLFVRVCVCVVMPGFLRGMETWFHACVIIESALCIVQLYCSCSVRYIHVETKISASAHRTIGESYEPFCSGPQNYLKKYKVGKK